MLLERLGEGVDSRGELVPGHSQLPLEIRGQVIDRRGIHVGWIPQILEAVWIMRISYSRMPLGSRGVMDGGGKEKAGRRNDLDQILHPAMGLAFSAFFSLTLGQYSLLTLGSYSLPQT